MPENENTRIWEAIKNLEFRLNTHTHIETDLTAALKKPDEPYIPGVYAGYVQSDGTAGTPFPEGWSATRVTTGEYKITHNLGTTEYSFIAVPSISFYTPAIFARNANDITVIFESAVSTPANTDFFFILVKP